MTCWLGIPTESWREVGYPVNCDGVHRRGVSPVVYSVYIGRGDTVVTGTTMTVFGIRTIRDDFQDVGKMPLAVDLLNITVIG